MAKDTLRLSGQEGLEQRVVGAAEHDGVQVSTGGAQFQEVVAGDLFGDRVIQPPLLGQGHQQGGRLAEHRDGRVQAVYGLVVGARLDGALGAEDAYLLGPGRLHGYPGAGLHHPHARHGHLLLQGIKGMSRRRVAGHQQVLDALIQQEAGDLERIADDRIARLCPVRDAGGVTQIDQVLPGQSRSQGPHHGQPTQA